MRVFVTGATGLIGRALCGALAARGDRVLALSRGRQAPEGAELVAGDPTVPGEWRAQLAGCDAVVHLAGEPLAAGRLDPAHRARVMDSRRDGTHALVAAIAETPSGLRPRVLLSASGADLYPFDESDRSYAENAGAGDSFLAQVCSTWEREARVAEAHGVRVVLLRNGVVLGRGGTTGKMLTPFRWFMGGPIGSGRQWFSWVSLDDAVGAYLHALKTDELSGGLNVVSPGVLRQKQFAVAVGRSLGRPSWLPVPAFALRAAIGGLAEYALHGRRVVPQALIRSGYGFRHADAAAALAMVV